MHGNENEAMPPPPNHAPHSPLRQPPPSYNNADGRILPLPPMSPERRSMGGAGSPNRITPVSPITGKPFSYHNNKMAPPFIPKAPSAAASRQDYDDDMPPEPSEKQRAMEAAATAERERARELEKEELEMTADELRAVLKRERRRTSKMAADLAVFRMTAVELQSEAEVHEEGRVNVLMRRLDDMASEKGRIILELEREEEHMTNTLQRQLTELRREKSVLQQQIDREKRSNSNLSTHLNTLKENNLAGLAEGDEEEEEDDDYDEDEQLQLDGYPLQTEE